MIYTRTDSTITLLSLLRSYSSGVWWVLRIMFSNSQCFTVLMPYALCLSYSVVFWLRWLHYFGYIREKILMNGNTVIYIQINYLKHDGKMCFNFCRTTIILDNTVITVKVILILIQNLETLILNSIKADRFFP